MYDNETNATLNNSSSKRLNDTLLSLTSPPAATDDSKSLSSSQSTSSYKTISSPSNASQYASPTATSNDEGNSREAEFRDLVMLDFNGSNLGLSSRESRDNNRSCCCSPSVHDVATVAEAVKLNYDEQCCLPASSVKVENSEVVTANGTAAAAAQQTPDQSLDRSLAFHTVAVHIPNQTNKHVSITNNGIHQHSSNSNQLINANNSNNNWISHTDSSRINPSKDFHSIGTSNDSLDLLTFSDDECEFLSKSISPSDASTVSDNSSAASSSIYSNVAASEQKTGKSENEISSQIDEALSFFHCSTMLTLPDSETIKNAILSNRCSLRPIAAVPQKELHDADRKSIYVVYQSSCTPVSWFGDSPNSDIREMILCACDAIVDGGFILWEIHELKKQELKSDSYSGEVGVFTTCFDDGTTFMYRKRNRYEFEEFHKLKNGGIYALEAATERQDLKRITGDRWRRLRIAIDPLKHVESQKAVKAMQTGSNLLKHTNLGFPHLRQFQLSSDCNRILWYSTDLSEQTSISIPAVKEVRLGQNTSLFKKYKLPALEHLSFSIIYDLSDTHRMLIANNWTKLMPQSSDKFPRFSSLDLTCKDEIEFDNWVIGLKALVCSANNMVISKCDLLSHSRRFRRAMESNTCGIKLDALPEVKQTGFSPLSSLEDCLELPVHSFNELEKKLFRLRGISNRAKQNIEEFNMRFNMDLSKSIEVTLKLSSEFSELADYDNSDTHSSIWPSLVAEQNADDNHKLLKSRTEAEDDLMEYVRMNELLSTANELLRLAEKQTEGVQNQNDDENNKTALKRINQILWKAEVDLENICDMHKRLVDRREEKKHVTNQIIQKFVEFNERFSSEIHKVGDQISTAMNNLFYNIQTSIESDPSMSTTGPVIRT